VKTSNNTPPKLVQRMLLRFLRDDLAEEVLGDLEEKFYATQKESLLRAKLNYWYQVFHYLRPFAIRKTSPVNILPNLMLQHIVLISFRNFRKYRSSFYINLIGLCTGLASVLLIYLWVQNEVSLDKFHEKDSRLYQIMRSLTHDDNTIEIHEVNSDLLAPALLDAMEEIEFIVPVSEKFTHGVVSAEGKSFRATGQFAGQDFFNVFSYKLIHGNKNQVLRDKYAIVISNELAIRLFGTLDNVIGKTVVLDDQQFGDTFQIAGIFEQAQLTSDPFDFLVTNEMLMEKNTMDVHWDSNTVYTYLTLKEGADATRFDAKIRDFVRKKFEAQYGSENLHWIGRLFLRHYSDRYLYNHYENGVPAGGRIDYVILFSVVGFFIIVIACINFMNLSTAQATRRIKEIGIKKAIGASRRSLAFQYLGESILLAFLSLMLAIFFVFLLLPQFNLVTGKQLAMEFDRNLIVVGLMIAFFTGLISGSYPAIYLSRFKPAEVLKGKLSTALGETIARKGLVVFQFCVSIILIVAVLIVYKQIDFIQSKNLGYERDNIITFERQGNLSKNLEGFLTELKNIPGVVNAAYMGGDFVGNHGGGGGIDWEGKTHRVEFGALWVNYDVIETLGVRIKEGRSFSRKFGSDTLKVIFNETAIAAMSLNDPIGQTVKLWGTEYQIIGVVKDFNFESLYNKVEPFFFAYAKNGENILVKVRSGMERETLARLEKLYHKFNPSIPFEFKFLDDTYQTLYAAEQRVANLSMYFAGIAILISCLGLFGLTVFTAERRYKEIGIRKVLGSSEFGIIYLLSIDFTKMVVLSICISLPLSYFLAEQWLDTFAYRIPLQWWYFVGTGTITVFIAWFTMGIQTAKAARINPVQCLKNE
jgi:putative ABC transport system permease protein